MIILTLNKRNLNIFLTNIEPKIRMQFNSILRNKTKEERDFLLYLRDTIGLTNILSATPDENYLDGIPTINDIESRINAKKYELRQEIHRTITPRNFKKLLNLLTGNELKNIMQKHNIKRKKATRIEQFIKMIENHTFNKNEKIKFQKQYFILITHKLCQEIFEDFYLNEWDNIPKYGKYKFVNALDLKTCPYCNRNYIFIVDNDKIRPEIDHFYPKSKYPYFAMSYFNLIPSCQTCNHTKSNNIDLNMINPYSKYKIENEINFSINIEKVNFLDIKKDKYHFDSFNIKINSQNNKNIDMFKLEKLYEQHKDVVVDLLIKSKYYPSKYISYLKRYGFSEDEIYRYLFNNFLKDKDLHKRPLSKLIRDIAIELQLIR